VILLTVGLVVAGQVQQAREKARSKGQPATDSASVADDAPPPPNAQLLMVARLAVGTKALAGQLPPAAQNAMPLDDFKVQLARAAKSPADRLRQIPVDVEVYGTKPEAPIQQFLESEPPPALRRDAEALLGVYLDGPGALDAAERQRLLSRHGWFAELALSHGLPQGAAERQAVLASAKRAFVASTVFGIVVVMAALAGLGLLVVAAVFYARGKLVRVYRPDPAAPGFFLEGFAVYLVVWVIASIVGQVFFPNSGIGAAPLITLPAVLLGVLWPVFRGAGTARVMEGLGLVRGAGFARELGYGIVGYLAGVPVLVAAFIVTNVLASRLNQTPTHPIQFEVSGGVLNALVLLAVASVWAPVTEELLFRGSFFHHVRRRHGWWVSALVVGVIFAAIHPQGWIAVPMITTIALVMAAIREWRGTIIAPVVAHAVNNGVVMAVTLLSAA
jgi:membrane protease YdiL (CAAX protease family)